LNPARTSPRFSIPSPSGLRRADTRISFAGTDPVRSTGSEMEEAMKRQLFAVAAVLVVALSAAGSAALAATAARGASSTTPTLSAAETSALQYMREEEKLARDVYTALAARWSTPVFRNISRSEQRHMDAVEVLLDRYEVADPAAGAAAGTFKNPTFQALYAKLVKQGSVSFAAAMAVGVQIEKLDIADLQSRLAKADKTDIRTVFTQLSRASVNHQRAFERHL
jgi:hypothetical protein